MGHAEISVTLNTYTHVKFEDAKSELEKVSNQDKIIVSAEQQAT